MFPGTKPEKNSWHGVILDPVLKSCLEWGMGPRREARRLTRKPGAERVVTSRSRVCGPDQENLGRMSHVGGK